MRATAESTWVLPEADSKDYRECDVVMKGGITSGVIYPRAIAEIAVTYRIRGLGGASAGAIGAALGAAAEFGRATGGFKTLFDLPETVQLNSLFKPQMSTRPMLRVLTSVAGFSRAGNKRPGVLRFVGILVGLVTAFPLATLIGLAPGAYAAWTGFASGSVLFGISGLVVALSGWVLAILARLAWSLTISVPRNAFGICTGYKKGDGEQLTNWLSERIDKLAGVTPKDGPLLFGQLWSGTTRPALDPPVSKRSVDLRMVATCLNLAKPYELPFSSGELYYDEKEWERLFPADVIASLRKQRPPVGDLDARRLASRKARAAAAKAHSPSLRRLPEAPFLPVVVATRMSLSFPLLISAVPLWAIDYAPYVPPRRRWWQHPASPVDPTKPRFQKLWFTDGGLSSNFPIHMFDSPLPQRPTLAINLGRLNPDLGEPSLNPHENVRFARTNSDQILTPYSPIPHFGLGAVAGFAGAALGTARDWRDNSHLTVPGYRDRIVQVLQSASEGGLNLFMTKEKITLLADRGQTAAADLVDQFTEKRYPTAAPDGTRRSTATGWENHRWLRYRTLVNGLADFARGFDDGLVIRNDAGEVVEGRPSSTSGSYPLTAAERALASRIEQQILEAAEAVRRVRESTIAHMQSSPHPATVIRRVPEV